QPQKSAAKAKPQRRRALWFKKERRIIEAKLLQGLAQCGVLMSVDRVKPGKNHGLNLFETGKSFRGGAISGGDGIADFCIGNLLEVGDHESYWARHQLIHGDRLGREDSQRLYFRSCAIRP